jgi:ribulose-5-phosphate 4-epimerase/fuculose-1-phosphate aldolase
LPSEPASDLAAIREQLATACRVLAGRGLASGILGHISVRVGTDRLLVRCRGPQERGLGFTTAADIQLLGLAGDMAPAAGYAAPNELPLHTEVLRRRPDVVAVVHAHPPQVVAADLAGIRIRPIVGAFDIPGTRLAAGGVPVYERSVLIRSPALAAEMVGAMGSRPVVLLRGHGLTSTGGSVAEAVLRAVSVDSLAGLSLAILAAGGTLADIPEADLAELPDLGDTLNQATAWRHEVARLGAASQP